VVHEDTVPERECREVPGMYLLVADAITGEGHAMLVPQVTSPYASSGLLSVLIRQYLMLVSP
jgi:hypothetical protein